MQEGFCGETRTHMCLLNQRLLLIEAGGKRAWGEHWICVVLRLIKRHSQERSAGPTLQCLPLQSPEYYMNEQ